MDTIKKIEKEFLKDRIEDFSIGDTLKVHLKIKEGTRERTQIFMGTLIARKGSGLNETITLRKISYSEGVERVVLLHSPMLEKIEVVRRGQVRQAKLYYIRDKVGKKAKVKEKK